MISYIGNRPVLQIGPYQVADYDVAWLDGALRRAASKADHEDFPFVEEICAGIVQYLETKCPLKLLHIDDLYAKLRRMLVQVGLRPIADHLEPVPPPVTLSLVQPALAAADNGFELAFFNALRDDLQALRGVGAEEIRVVGLRPSVLILRQTQAWNRACDTLLKEIHSFIMTWNRDQTVAQRPLKLVLEKAC